MITIPVILKKHARYWKHNSAHTIKQDGQIVAIDVGDLNPKLRNKLMRRGDLIRTRKGEFRFSTTPHIDYSIHVNAPIMGMEKFNYGTIYLG
jgi:hypothetical protein